MALGKEETVKRLVTAVAHGDMASARKAVLQICAETTTEKHRRYCEQIKTTVKKQPQLVNLSFKTQGLVYREEVSLFDEDLFFVTPREQALLSRIETMDRTTEQLQAAGVNFRNATLLYGPTGCGKTAFAKYVAKKMGRELYIVNLASIIGGILGETAKNLQSVFRDIANVASNCILLLDELDAISNNRDAAHSLGGPDKELSRATMSMMQELDILPPRIILLAATNHIESLDAAMRRRFTIQHEFSYYDEDELVCMVQKYLETVKARNAFPIVWCDGQLLSFARRMKGKGQSSVIEAIAECIADMVSAENSTLSFPT